MIDLHEDFTHSDDPCRNGESGQVFFEFVLLLLVIITLSYTMLYGVNRGIAERWQRAIHLITKVEGSPPPEIQ